MTPREGSGAAGTCLQDVCRGYLVTDFVVQTASTLQFRSGLDALPWSI